MQQTWLLILERRDVMSFPSTHRQRKESIIRFKLIYGDYCRQKIRLWMFLLSVFHQQTETAHLCWPTVRSLRLLLKGTPGPEQQHRDTAIRTKTKQEAIKPHRMRLSNQGQSVVSQRGRATASRGAEAVRRSAVRRGSSQTLVEPCDRSR